MSKSKLKSSVAAAFQHSVLPQSMGKQLKAAQLAHENETPKTNLERMISEQLRNEVSATGNEAVKHVKEKTKKEETQEEERINLSGLPWLVSAARDSLLDMAARFKRGSMGR